MEEGQPAADALLPRDVYAFPLIPRSLWILSLSSLAQRVRLWGSLRASSNRWVRREKSAAKRAESEEARLGNECEGQTSGMEYGKRKQLLCARNKRVPGARNRNPAALFLRSRSKYCPSATLATRPPSPPSCTGLTSAVTMPGNWQHARVFLRAFHAPLCRRYFHPACSRVRCSSHLIDYFGVINNIQASLKGKSRRAECHESRWTACKKIFSSKKIKFIINIFILSKLYNFATS